MQLSTFANATTPEAEEHTTTFREFLEDFETPHVLEEPATLERADAIKLHMPAWSPAVFTAQARGKQNVRTLGCVVFDLDGRDKQGVLHAELQALLHASGLNYALHSTTRSGFCPPARAKLRLIFPLATAVTASEYDRLWVELSTHFAITADVDHSCREPSRLYFVPAIFREHMSRYVFAARTDGADVGATAGTFSKRINSATVGGVRDESSWLESVHTAGEKMHALSRAVYAVAILRTQAARTVDDLPELFEAALHENARRGSSAAVRDWSHARREIEKLIGKGVEQAQLEASAPSTTEVDARVLSFAKKQLEKLVKAVQTGKSELRDAAFAAGRLQHAFTAGEVEQQLTTAARARTKGLIGDAEIAKIITSGLQAGASKPIGTRSAWQQDLQVDKELGYTTCDHNVHTALREHPDMRGVLGWCVRRAAPIYLCDAPWGAKAGTELQDADAVDALAWLGSASVLNNRGAKLASVMQALLQAARRSGVPEHDPFLEYVATLPKATSYETLERVLIDHAGAEDSAYTRLVTRAWFTAVYARQVVPGCKADAALVLAGAQGVGKSSFFRAIFPAALQELCSTSHLPSWDDKDVHIALSRFAVVELAELASVKYFNLEPVKAIMTQSSAKVRAAYQRLDTLFLRRAVFGGSTNEDEFLIDTTGNRRFWAVKVGAFDIPAITALCDTLWSEARFCYEAGLGWWADTEEQRAMVAEAQQDFEVQDVEADRLLDALDETVGTVGSPWRVTGQSADGDRQIRILQNQAGPDNLVKWITVEQMAQIVHGKQAEKGRTKTMKALLKRKGWKEGVVWSAGKSRKALKRPGAPEDDK